MTEHTMGRREMLMGAGVAAGGVALTGLGASPAMASDHAHDQLTGSWLIVHQDDPPGDTTPVTAVASFAGGGVIINHDINPAGPPFTGTWARNGNRFRATLWSGFSSGGAPDAPSSTIRVRIRGRLKNDSISGTAAFAVFDPAGKVAQSGTGTFRGTRIEA
ncbi:MAG: hypothetical protein ACXV3C_11350 [Actinomycetes bacterium]